MDTLIGCTLIDKAGTFREEDHPRADDGKFGSGGGGSGSEGEPSKPAEKPKPGKSSLKKWQKEALEAQTAKLSPEHRGVVEEYQTSGMYDPLNNYLRTGKLSPTSDLADMADDLFQGGFDDESEGWAKQQIAALDEAISNTVLHGDSTVYRGLNKSVVDSLKPGQTFQDNGYMSTSFDPDTARGFAGEGGALLKIKAKHGTNALYADPITDLGQQELIFPRGSKMKVSAVRNEAGVKVVYAELQ